MSKYIIHTMPKRLWYVEQFLIPSILEQGIDKDCIEIFNDDKNMGNLQACLKCFSQLPEEGSTWHLQDDVIISHDFKQVTEIPFNKNTIACGFCSRLYDKENPSGVVSPLEMWFSFQCILIPNNLAKECVPWTKEYIIGNPVYKKYWEKGLNDDWCFRQYIRLNHPDCSIINIKPNIVDHIDWLIGGSVISERTQEFRSRYWNDIYLINELERKLKKCHFGQH